MHTAKTYIEMKLSENGKSEISSAQALEGESERKEPPQQPQE